MRAYDTVKARNSLTWAELKNKINKVHIIEKSVLNQTDLVCLIWYMRIIGSLLCMNDLKLYTVKYKQLETLLQIVYRFIK